MGKLFPSPRPKNEIEKFPLEMFPLSLPFLPFFFFLQKKKKKYLHAYLGIEYKNRKI